VQGRVKLEFRCWNADLSVYEWIDYTSRFIRAEELKIEAESSVTGYRAYYPTLSKIFVDNSDQFWNALTRTAAELAAGPDTYRSGFRNRLARLTVYRSADDHQSRDLRFVGAVANLTVQPENPEAVIELVSLQQLAMESKCEGEELEGETAYGDWWDTDVPSALYASRRVGMNGGYAAEWFRHKRVYSVFKRTKLPVTDIAADEDIDNVRLTTSDDRHTLTAVSLPAEAELTPLGFTWGPATGDTAYLIMRSTSGATDTLHLYTYDHETGEIALVGELFEVSGSNCTLAWCSLNYNQHVNKLYVCVWSQVGGGGAWTPWLVEWNFATTTATATNMQTWATGLGTATTTFHDFLFFTNCRGTTETTAQGTLWVILDTDDPGIVSSNRIVEISCWNIGAIAVQNDSLATYRKAEINWTNPVALYPAACAEYAQADPNAAYVDIGSSPDILLYITGNERWGLIAPSCLTHQWIFRLGIASGSWIAVAAVTTVHYDDPAGAGIAGWGEMVETTWGLVFTRWGTGTISGDELVGKTFANYAASAINCVIIEPEFNSGDGAAPGLAASHFPDNFRETGNSRVIYNYENDRFYYFTAPLTALTSQWNTRFRSASGAGAAPSAPKDENTNPYVADGLGDMVSDFAVKSQSGLNIALRVGTDYDGDEWELHAIVLQSNDAPILVSYAPRFRPCIPLVDLGGLSVWETRSLLAEICGATHGYDVEGGLFLKERPSFVPEIYWPDGKLTIKDTGWRQIANTIAFLPYIVEQTSDGEGATIGASTIGSGSTGALLVVHVGATPDANLMFRMRFTGTSAYNVDQWIANVWTSIGNATKDTIFRCDQFSLTPDCWAGTFVEGDMFTFTLYGSMYMLRQLGRMNRIEVRDADSIALWGDQAVDIDNRFAARSQAIELLTAALSWSKGPHRRFQSEVDVNEVVALNEVRVLSKGEMEAVCALVGLKQKPGEPHKVLTYVEY